MSGPRPSPTASAAADLPWLLALTCIRGIGSVTARLLVEQYGSARAVFNADRRELAAVPRVGHALLEGMASGEAIDRARCEVAFMEAHRIRPLVYRTEGYPRRLAECPDAPLVLFYRGDADLDAPRVVSIVGTRRATTYGRDMTARLVADLASALPGAVVISGLAIGIDAAAHKAALAEHAPTVGVLAHGLDRIYPAVHRPLAARMLGEGGGLITEYFTTTEPERGNFLARNRIIAGLADATVVVESADRGGALVTASIAIDYDRDVFAVPGRVGDRFSEGCNRFIRTNKAALITSTDDLITMMNWGDTTPARHVQRELPFVADGSPRSRILEHLRTRGSSTATDMAQALTTTVAALAEELLMLEMDGVVRALPGGIYRLR